jgi:small-conductance mechanosensitive channel
MTAIVPTGVAGAASSADAKQTAAPEIPAQLTREEVRDLLSKLSDDQVRALLIRELDKEAVDASGEAPGKDVDAVDQLHDAVEMARVQLAGILNSWPKLAGLPGQIWSDVTLGGAVSSWQVVLGLVLMLAAGWIAETLLCRATGIGSSPPDSTPKVFVERVGASLVRALMRFLALLVFGVAAFIVMCVAVWNNDGAEPLFIMLLSTTVIIRSIAILMDVVLAPHASGNRLVTLDDSAVVVLRRRLLILAGFLVVDFAVVRSIDSFGIEAHVIALLHLINATFIVIALIIMIWEARHPYAAIIRGGGVEQVTGESGFVDTVAAYWHLIAIAAVLILFALAIGKLGVAEADADYPGVKTLILLMLLPLIDVGLRRMVSRIFEVKKEGDDGGAEAEKSLLSLAPASAADRESSKVASREVQAVVLKNLRILLGLIAVLLTLSIWGIEVGAAATSMAGERVGTALFDIVVIVLLAYAIWSLVKAAVSYHLGTNEAAKEEGSPGGEGDIGGSGQTRMQTLLPLFRKVILITLVIMGLLLMLSSLGVNIGPLIAGAGVVGLAIGFGAQTLVRDIVSGVFFLLDDAFRMGEYVSIGDVRGVVEGISIRSLRLRHHNGPLHTIPFGEIKHLTNYSRDWAIMKFELRLPFETDINKVRKIIKTVGQEMENDEELSALMMAPLKSQGVNRMEDSALIIRCKFTAVPGQQFYVRREAFTRIQKAFEENGIRFAPKRVIVEAATPALAMAGAAALETEEPQGPAVKSDDRG